jgi:hypothetical protein
MKILFILSLAVSSFAFAQTDLLPKGKLTSNEEIRKEHKAPGHGAIVVEKNAVLNSDHKCSEHGDGPCKGNCGDQSCGDGKCQHKCSGDCGDKGGHQCGGHSEGGHKCGGEGHKCGHHGMHGWGPGTGFNIGMGYVDARWDKFSTALSRGAPYFEFEFNRMFGEHFMGLIGLHMHQSLNGSIESENVYAFDVRLGGRWMFLDSWVKPFAGAALSFGGYRAWSVASDTPTQLVQTKHGSGALVGVSPELGVRFNLSPSFGVDLLVRYNSYIGAQAWRVGGLQGGLNLAFFR